MCHWFCFLFKMWIGDAKKPKAWSKYAPDSSAYRRLHNEQPEVESGKTDVGKKKKTKNENKINSEVLDKVVKVQTIY